MGLGDLVLETLKGMIDYIIELADDFGDVIKRGLRMFLSSLLSDDLKVMEEIYDNLFSECPQVSELWRKEKESVKSGETGALNLLGMVLSAGIGTGIGMGAGGFGRDIQNFFNTIRPVTPLSPDILAYGKHIGMMDDNLFKTDLLSQGFSEDKHNIIYSYYKPKLLITELLTAEKRIEKLDYDVNNALKEAGYNDKEISILRELSWYYPSPTDFIRFAVREVFTEDKETQEALGAEFPEDIVKYAEKAGMRKDVLEWYWKAHWELPSPTQVYEMLHRLNPDVLEVRKEAYKEMGLDEEKLKTDLETVKFYLKQADYDKRWRERLLAISYNPLTRVDLRRVYELGLIDDKEVVARLMEVGYTKADAELLLNFYKSLKVGAEKDLTKSEILRLFRYGEITEEECLSMLMDLGYDETEANFIISLEIAKEAEDEIDDIIDTLTEKFVWGEITEKEFVEELDKLGIKATRRDKIVEKARRRKERMVRMPTKEDIIKWYNSKLIDEDKARELLSLIRIPTEYHDYYLGKKKE